MGNKKNKQWIWLSIDRKSRKIVGVHVGSRDRRGAQALWDSLPQVYRECDVCYTDFWSAYNTIIPEKCHKAVGKETGETNHIERFNNTMVNGFHVWSEALFHFQKNFKTILELYGTSFIITILTLLQNLLSLHVRHYQKLDEYRSYIIHLLQSYPDLSAVKILRKLKAKVELLDISDRSVRRYIESLKVEISVKQGRYYEPVIDMVAGVQCQVDGGEMRGVMVGGKETTVYFTVFVLSYSRLMYVSLSSKPIDTQTLIYQHDAAFRYFGGLPQECVYDQSKLVVISETFRELELNERFHQYATTAGFNIRACEGYDPESKGKVESGVKYVQQNGLYGEEFKDWQGLESYIVEWLDTFANQRLHGTTGKQPSVHYELEGGQDAAIFYAIYGFHY